MQQEQVESFIQQLCDAQTEAGKKAWSEFFCDVPLVRAVTATFTQEQAARILAEGARWEGEGLNTSKASRRLFEACGVALVSGDFEVYKNAFLLSFALTWGI